MPERFQGRGEFAADPSLSPHLVCLWSTVVERGPVRHLVLPDACIDIVFVGDRPPIVAGPATLPVRATIPPGTVVFGARFRPGAAPSWLKVSARALLDCHVPLQDLLGRPAATLAQQVLQTPAAAGRLHLLQDFLTSRLRTVRPTDQAVDAVASRIATTRLTDIGSLCGGVGLSERQLLRRCRERLGYGPKTLHRILRLQHLLLLAARRSVRQGGLAALAAVAGYADQAHMARDVRALTGLTPGDLLKRNAGTLGMSDLFKPSCKEID